MKLNVGAGALRLDGFLNVDVRAVGSDSRRGHAGDLSFAGDGKVDVLFSNAVFEHVYPAQRLVVLREWKRVLAPGGVIVCIGLPNFEAIAQHYLDRARGTTGDVFDLFEVYRYTHGEPEQSTPPVWAKFDPLKHEDSGPHGYVPQLHKGLFDGRHLSALLREVALPGRLLTYAYPGEEPVINIGFIAGAGCDDQTTAAAALARIGPVDRFIRLDTLTWHPIENGADRATEVIQRWEAQRPASLTRRAARFGKRTARRLTSSSRRTG